MSDIQVSGEIQEICSHVLTNISITTGFSVYDFIYFERKKLYNIWKIIHHCEQSSVYTDNYYWYINAIKIKDIVYVILSILNRNKINKYKNDHVYK